MTASHRPSARLFTSESVTEGHPDKVCDRISDAVLDAILAQDPSARVAVETMATPGLVHVAGEVTTTARVEIPRIVHEEISAIGYTSPEIGFDGASCDVLVSVGRQSPDIAAGVDASLQARQETGRDPFDLQGAGDQGLMFGYACTDTAELMPLPIHLAHRLAERLALVRKQGVVAGLRPDGKTQVTIDYDGDRPARLAAVVVSAQHDPHLGRAALTGAVSAEVIAPVLAAEEAKGLELDAADAQVLINPSGQFVIGGPAGDAGAPAPKTTADPSAAAAPPAGGAFSAKAPPTVARPPPSAIRWTATTLVAAGLPRRRALQVPSPLGSARPVGLHIETFATHTVPVERIRAAIEEVFDLRPAAMIAQLDLLRPIYRDTSAYGHFGRPGFSWEATDRVRALRDAV